MTDPYASNDDYAIPTGDTGHEVGTFLMKLTSLRPFTLYETTKGWTRQMPEDGSIVEAYNKIEWTFVDEDGEVGYGQTSTARSERSTLYAWATGLGLPAAVVLDRSQPIPAKDIVGRSAMVTFAPDKNGYSRISSVVPAPRQRAPLATPAGFTPAEQPNPGNDAPFGADTGPQPTIGNQTAADLPF